MSCISGGPYLCLQRYWRHTYREPAWTKGCGQPQTLIVLAQSHYSLLVDLCIHITTICMCVCGPFSCVLLYPLYTVVRCPVLSAPTNGLVFASSRTPDSQASYSCNSGYVLQGSATRVCLDGGVWSGQAPQCVGKAVCELTFWVLLLV